MRPTTLRLAAAVLFSAAASGAFSSASEAAAGSAPGTLVLTAFVQRGRTDVRRNEMLEFRFSTRLRKTSVGLRTLQINALTAAGRVPATGARIVQGNVVRFDPRRTQRNYEESLLPKALVVGDDHWQGFAGLQTYDVLLPASHSGLSLRSRSGQRIAKRVSTTFATSDAYEDPVPGQPYFIGDYGSGVFGFEPPRSGALGLVEPDAAVVLEFNEPILAGSLVPGTTVLVTHAATGETVPGTITADTVHVDRARYLFSPTGGWGLDATTNQGWDIRIELTTGITDLAGNPLKRPVLPMIFRTR